MAFRWWADGGPLMLRLHYVPGSHGSPKRSSPWCFGNFCLRIQVLLRFVLISHCLSRYVGTDSRRVHGAQRSGPLSVTVGCTFPPDLPRSVGTSHVSSRFDQVLPRLSSSVKVSYGETWTTVLFEPVQCAHGIKKRSQSCCKHCILNL